MLFLSPLISERTIKIFHNQFGNEFPVEFGNTSRNAVQITSWSMAMPFMCKFFSAETHATVTRSQNSKDDFIYVCIKDINDEKTRLTNKLYSFTWIPSKLPLRLFLLFSESIRFFFHHLLFFNIFSDLNGLSLKTRENDDIVKAQPWMASFNFLFHCQLIKIV